MAGDGLYQISNLAQATLTANVALGDTSWACSAGQGAAFPVTTTKPPFIVCIFSSLFQNPADDVNAEFCLVNTHAAGSDAMSVITRGQLGSAAAAHVSPKIILPPVDYLFKMLAAGLGNFSTDSGVVNAYITTIAMHPPLSGGMEVCMKPLNTNTGPATLNHNGSGVLPITWSDGSPLTGGELIASNRYVFRYNLTSTRWELQTNIFPTPILGLLNDYKFDKVFKPRIPTIAGGVVPADQAVIFLYMGFATRPLTINWVSAMLTGNYTSMTASEVGLFSSPGPPDKGNLTMTKLTSQTITASLTAGAPKVVRNNTAMATVIPAGTHWWAAIRIDYNVLGSGSWRAVAGDFGGGNIQSVVSATTMASASSYAATIPTDTDAALGTNLQAECT